MQHSRPSCYDPRGLLCMEPARRERIPPCAEVLLRKTLVRRFRGGLGKPGL